MKITEIAPQVRAALPRVMAITGPTAVGKTALSLAVAKRFGADIVGLDSVQVYRELDIGSAKPTLAQRAEVPHHLIDEIWPDASFSVADYRARALGIIASLHAQGKRVLLVGGTGMYLRLLIHGLVDAPGADEGIRARHAAWAKREGIDALYGALMAVDPELATRLHPHDLVRVSRGLEVWELCGRKFSQLQREHEFRTPAFHALKIALVRPREEIYARVEARVDQMLEAGLMAECAHLVETYGCEVASLGTLGYKQMVSHLVHGVPREEAVAQMKQYTRRYAKSQLNWLRSEPGVHWVKAPLLGARGELPGAFERDVAMFFEQGIQPVAPDWAGAKALGFAVGKSGRGRSAGA